MCVPVLSTLQLHQLKGDSIDLDCRITSLSLSLSLYHPKSWGQTPALLWTGFDLPSFIEPSYAENPRLSHSRKASPRSTDFEQLSLRHRLIIPTPQRGGTIGTMAPTLLLCHIKVSCTHQAPEKAVCFLQPDSRAWHHHKMSHTYSFHSLDT